MVKIVDKNKKKEDILEAAILVFSRKGFSEATISDIALESGIGKGTVYEYFRTKGEIVLESFRFIISGMEKEFEDILDLKIPAKERLGQMIDSICSFVSGDNSGLVDLMINYWGEAMRGRESKEAIFDDLKRFYKDFRKIFSRLIMEGIKEGSFRKDIHPENAASLILASLDGLFLQWSLDKRSVALRKINRFVKNIIFNGICVEKT